MQHEVALDSVRIRSRDWAKSELFDAGAMRQLLPDCLVGASKDCLNSADLSSSNTEQSSGIRVELRASFVYHVETLHKNVVSDFFLTGCSNAVTPRKVARRRRGFLSRLTDKFTVTREELEHVRSVNSGKVFLTDTLGLAQELRIYGVNPEVCSTGYIVSADADSGVEIRILFEYDQADQPVLRAVIDLGNADRNRFPEYMETSQTLSLGVLGLVEANNRSIERLVLVDSRPV